MPCADEEAGSYSSSLRRLQSPLTPRGVAKPTTVVDGSLLRNGQVQKIAKNANGEGNAKCGERHLGQRPRVIILEDRRQFRERGGKVNVYPPCPQDRCKDSGARKQHPQEA